MGWPVLAVATTLTTSIFSKSHHSVVPLKLESQPLKKILEHS